MEESDLIKKLKRGKEEAYNELINLYGNKLLRTCYLMVKDEKDAEDIVQETFINVFKYVKNFNEKSSLYTWIYRISQNITKDRLKSKIATAPYEDNQIELNNPEDITIVNIDREILRLQLDKLSFKYKQVIVLYYFNDLSIKEISEILDEKEGTIKSRLSRGRNLLKESMEKGDELNV